MWKALVLQWQRLVMGMLRDFSGCRETFCVFKDEKEEDEEVLIKKSFGGLLWAWTNEKKFLGICFCKIYYKSKNKEKSQTGDDH